MKKFLLSASIALGSISFGLAQTYNWNDIITGIVETGGSRPDCISIFPVDNSTLIGGTSFGIYKSTNNGANWALTSPNFFTCQQVIKTSNGKLVAAGQGVATQAGKHVMTSADNGSTWTGVTFNSTVSNVQLRDIVKDNNENLYVGGYSNTVSTATGVYKSTDGGDTWTYLGNSGLPTGILFVGGVFTDDGTNILLGTNKGISKSADGGATFTQAGGITNYVYRMRKNSGGKIFAASDDGVYVSTNNGTSFTKEISSASMVFDILIQNDTLVVAHFNGGISKYSTADYTPLGNIGTTTNGLSSLRLRGIAVNSAGDYFAATDGTSNTNGRKFHTTATVGGGSTGTAVVHQSLFFELFPNPTADLVNMAGNFNWNHIVVTDITGKVLADNHSASQSIDVSTLTNGIYFVTCSGEQGRITQRFVVQH